MWAAVKDCRRSVLAFIRARGEQVIASIDAKTNIYFIDPYNGKRSEVGVVRPTGRPAYVRAYADRGLE